MGERRRRRPAAGTRRERDLLGELEVPAQALYGIHTVRSLNTLSFSGRKLGDYPVYVGALAMVKKAAARANRDAAVLPARVARAIEYACDALIRGEHAEQFPVDMLGGGGEIAVNMNVNEVIANLANQLLGERRADDPTVHPKTHVNASQSTSEVCHSAARIALVQMWHGLESALEACAAALDTSSRDFAAVMTLARTCLRDAEATSLGEFFGGQAQAIRRRARELGHSIGSLRRINLGGTAIGSGRGAPTAYRARVVRHAREITGIALRTRANLYDAAQNLDDLGEVGAQLGLLAEVLIKIAADLRLLSSGPDGGFGELTLPAVQEGSSFFPGKINPSVPETILQCCFQVLGCERSARLAVERGELNLNIFGAAAVTNLFDMISMLQRALVLLVERCLQGMTANTERCRALATRVSAGQRFNRFDTGNQP
ncbi:MAG: aspartate ammonia-lyase [Deltaproteobacteria bacterium]|nr:aspartate ammonia-lyase [Deltaproteobacteria bacterium]